MRNKLVFNSKVNGLLLLLHAFLAVTSVGSAQALKTKCVVTHLKNKTVLLFSVHNSSRKPIFMVHSKWQYIRYDDPSVPVSTLDNVYSPKGTFIVRYSERAKLSESYTDEPWSFPDISSVPYFVRIPSKMTARIRVVPIQDSGFSKQLRMFRTRCLFTYLDSTESGRNVRELVGRAPDILSEKDIFTYVVLEEKSIEGRRILVKRGDCHLKANQSPMNVRQLRVFEKLRKRKLIVDVQ